MLREFGCQVWRKYIRKVDILVKDLCKSLFDNQAGYLRFMRRVDICIKRDGVGETWQSQGTQRKLQRSNIPGQVL